MTEKIRLSKVMSARGLCSRREADRFIEKGWVLVDSKPVNQLGTKIDESQKIELSPQAQKIQSRQETILLNKPVGYVSGLAEDGHESAVVLVRPENRFGNIRGDSRNYVKWKGLAPAGRLDIDSQGLIVFTKDGRVARQLIGENSDVEKEYLIWVHGDISEDKLALLRHGLELDGKPLKKAKIKAMDAHHIQFILKEGRKRQIRRMCDLVGLKVTRLMRVRIGKVKLENLPAGKWRHLAPGETF